MNKTTRTQYFAAGAVSLLTFLVFLPALRNGFVNWDDNVYIYENIFIRTLNSDMLVWAISDLKTASNWHPLTWISHALDYAAWGLNPMGHHLTNNILHAANTFLVVLLVVRLIEAVYSKQHTVSSMQPGEDSKQHAVNSMQSTAYSAAYSLVPTAYLRFTLIAAATTGLLFGIHPLHVESVAWVSERKDVLCGFFFLLSILMYLKYASAIALHSAEGKEPLKESIVPGAWRIEVTTLCSMRYALGFFILALMSKPMAVTLPVVLLILDWYPLGRMRSFSTLRGVVMEKLPFFALSLASSVITIFAQGAEAQSMGALPIPTRLITAATSLVTYLRKMVLPLDLSPFYSYPHDVSFFVLKYFLPVMLAIGITAVAAAVAGRRKIWSAVWGYYVLTLLPVLGIVQVGDQSMADRYTYLPSLGPFLIAGLALAFIYKKIATDKNRLAVRLSLPVLAAVICASMIYLTTKQTAVWKDSLTLWNYVIRMEPGKAFFPYNNRGIAYSDMGRYDRALEDYNKVIAMNPEYFRVYNNRGVVYSRQGLYDAAIEDFSRAIALSPDFYDAYNNRGVAFDKAGRFEKAMENFQKALVLNPGFERAYINRGVAYQRAGMLDRAVEDFNTALSINPRSEAAYNNRGICFYKKGDLDRAIEEYTKAIAINPYSQESYYNRGVSYYRKGLLDKAGQDMNMSASLARKEKSEK